MSQPPPSSFKRDLANVGRGFLMGGADIVPGVSGGTVALIVGVYERLVTALSHFDLALLAELRERRWASAAAHVDLRFLVALGSGVVLGITGLAGVMHHLLTHHRAPTMALLFGLIAASGVLVALMVERWRPAGWMALVAGAAFAWWLVGLLPASAPESRVYLFICGAIAICAMILPGISGAFLLLILGLYARVIGVLKDVLKGHWSGDNLVTIAVFVAGCGVGLLVFSKFLRWLLTRHEAVTMAALCGFMFGSLRRIWPFKDDVTSAAYLRQIGLEPSKIEAWKAAPESLDSKYHLLENTWPAVFGSEVLVCLLLAAAGAAAVLLLDLVTRAHRDVPPLESVDHPSHA